MLKLPMHNGGLIRHFFSFGLYLIATNKLLFSKSFLRVILFFNAVYVYVSVCGCVNENAGVPRSPGVRLIGS